MTLNDLEHRNSHYFGFFSPNSTDFQADYITKTFNELTGGFRDGRDAPWRKEALIGLSSKKS